MVARYLRVQDTRHLLGRQNNDLIALYDVDILSQPAQQPVPAYFGVIYDEGNRHVTHLIRPVEYFHGSDDDNYALIPVRSANGSAPGAVIMAAAEPIDHYFIPDFLRQYGQRENFAAVRQALEEINRNPGNVSITEAPLPLWPPTSPDSRAR